MPYEDMGAGDANIGGALELKVDSVGSGIKLES